ncbi:MAG: DNA-binding response regulator [Oceanospirillales bacterium LUC14_002_19_P2]|nr:MAG: DNA-binding response regulator [Oceanospirillales bacterium LUC14_002_19_P2]
MNVLLVEDDDLQRHHLGYQLESLEFRVYAAPEAREALFFSDEYAFDVAIIDLGLPGMDGIDLIKTLRQRGRTYPILILTARGKWEDKVNGLEAGGDDYVVKPFQFEELKARLNALISRASGFSHPKISAGPYRLDLSAKKAWVGDTELVLTAYEYKILEYLMRHDQQVVSKTSLMEQLYADDDRDSNVLEVLVGRLRRKLSQAGGESPIDTIRGQGYLFTLSCS